MRPDNLLRILFIPLLLVSGIASGAACAADSIPKGYLGRWDVTLHTPERDLPTWLEIGDTCSSGPSVRMVGRWGHARRLAPATFADGKLRFVSPKEEEGRKDEMVFTATLDGDALVGETSGPDGTVWKFRGERAPALKRSGSPAWGKPVTLFNGKDLTGWHSSDPKAAPTWRVENGVLVSTGNGAELVTDQKFGDFKLHIEFWIPNLPADVTGQARGNSGIYLQDRYELQVLDSFGKTPATNECGAFYEKRAPDSIRSTAPETWQTYEITFRAARYNGTTKIENARATVVWNGVVVHNNVEINGSTGAGAPETPALGPIRLQDHGDAGANVRYRTIWVEPIT